MGERTVTIPKHEMAGMMGDLLRQRLVAEGFATEPGAKAVFFMPVEIDIAGEWSFRRLADGSCVFVQTVAEPAEAD